MLFENAIADIINSNIIMTNQPLLNLVKLFAYNDLIRGCITDCYRGIDYDEELAEALDSGEDRYHFYLPKSNRAIVAVVSKLLYEFAAGTQEFEKFIVRVYPMKDLNSSFQAFAENILLPFKVAFFKVFLYEVNEEEIPTEAKQFTSINPAVIEEVKAIAAEMRIRLKADNKITNEERRQLQYITDGFCDIMENDLARLVLPMWYAFNLSFKDYKKYKVHLERLDEILKKYLVIS
jgi:hypothetical protein